MYYKKIVGDKLYLSPIDIEKESKILTKWVNEDPEIAYNNGFYDALIGEEKMRQKLETWNESPFCFAIVNKQDDAFMGQISLFNIDPSKSYATLGIFLGGDYRHQGYGSEAIKLLVNYAFTAHRFKAIHLEVFKFNQKAIAAYRKIGFKECGVWHKSRYHEGKFRDIVLMEMVKKDY